MKPILPKLRLPRLQLSKFDVSITEAVVSCALVMMVFTLVLPGVSAAVSNRNYLCIANMKQIQVATGLYMQDYEQTLPIAWRTVGVEGGFGSWRDQVFPYLKSNIQGRNSKVTVDTHPALHCPADTKGPAWISYAVNSLVTGVAIEGEESQSESLASVANPDQVVWLGDTNKNWKRGVGFHDTIADWVRPTLDLGVPNTDDRAVNFYYRWLKERDWTDLTASGLDCPDGIFQCKYPSFHHQRSGEKTGYAHFLMMDGHVSVFRWGQANVENFFPHLTPEQIAKYHPEGE
jgi:prepilin-type processing-associated H-X9-DG protein